jgi:phosphatidylethanolamine/phosphatidyl-N-methylethanolamine N-methyltransferase
MWNRLRYTLWAPAYDSMVRLATRFDAARRRSIERLALAPGNRVLIIGAGTGLDLPHLPAGVRTVAVDVTPAMLSRLRRRAERLGLDVEAHTMDARALAFDDDAFDAVVMHLILAVMPQPELGLREAARVVRPGGRIAVFDKFLREGERPSFVRRLGNPLVKLLFSDLNRRLAPLVAATPLVVEHDDAAAFGGMFRVVTLRKPA